MEARLGLSVVEVKKPEMSRVSMATMFPIDEFIWLLRNFNGFLQWVHMAGMQSVSIDEFIWLGHWIFAMLHWWIYTQCSTLQFTLHFCNSYRWIFAMDFRNGFIYSRGSNWLNSFCWDNWLKQALSISKCKTVDYWISDRVGEPTLWEHFRFPEK